MLICLIIDQLFQEDHPFSVKVPPNIIAFKGTLLMDFQTRKQAQDFAGVAGMEGSPGHFA